MVVIVELQPVYTTTPLQIWAIESSHDVIRTIQILLIHILIRGRPERAGGCGEEKRGGHLETMHMTDMKQIYKELGGLLSFRTHSNEGL